MKHPVGEEPAETESESQVDDSEALLRLLWAEHDVRNGRIWPEAISRSDLSGEPSRGFSVDREELACREVMEALVEYQRPRANKPGDRQAAFLSRIVSAKSVRELTDTNGERPFLVETSPTKPSHHLPANPAHAEIKSAQKCSKSRQNERRQLLLELLGPPIKIDEYWDVYR